MKAWDDGAWVREAALAHARKQASAIDARTSRGSDRSTAASNEWPLWEVFVRSKAGLDHKHCGSLHAADAQMAIQLARDVYTRRQEGTSIWVVRSDQIIASDPADKDDVLRSDGRQGLSPPDVLRAAEVASTTCERRRDDIDPARPRSPPVHYLLRIADTCLIQAQRLAEWCGHAPVLEEDIALSNMALDLLGQARAVLTRAGASRRAGGPTTRTISPSCATSATSST